MKDKNFERLYTLNIARLKNGHHQDAFDIDQRLFAYFENSEVEEAAVKATLAIHKTDVHTEIKFHFLGKVSISCDRCLLPFDQPIDAQVRIIYAVSGKAAAMEEDDGDEVIFIDAEEPFLNLTQDLYDYLCLEIPFKKIPPDCNEQKCGHIYRNIINLSEEDTDTQDTDPRWEALKKLKDEGKS